MRRHAGRGPWTLRPMSTTGEIMTHTAIPTSLPVSGRIPAQLFATLISSSDDAIIVKSLDGVIWTWNQGAMRMYGYTPDEAIGQPMTMLCPPDRAYEIAEILAKVKNGERISHFETRRRRKDGTTFPVSVSVSPVNDEYGNTIGAASIARDITAQDQARAAAALAVRNEDMELSNQSLRSFADSMAHDLRAPLRALAGYSGLLLEQCSDAPRRERPGLRRADRHCQPGNVHAHRGPGGFLPLPGSHHAPPDRRPQRRDR